MTHDEMIAVIRAHKEGKVVQFQYADSNGILHWMDSTTGIFNFGDCDYRVKPEPREVWIVGCTEVYRSLEGALSSGRPRAHIIHYREVIE